MGFKLEWKVLHIFCLIAACFLSTGEASNPEENGPYLEGDIMEPLPTMDTRSGHIDPQYRWPDRTVIYEFNSSFPADFRMTFLLGLNQIAGRTCIRFRERTNETDYVHVWQGSGCSSFVGRKGGRQDLSLASGCSRFGTHVHEMIHAIGFFHEQSRSDRDDFVRINWENIEEGKEHNFDKRNTSVVSPFDVPYDYGSVMHYSRSSFSANGLDTISPLDLDAEIGQRIGMSDSDWTKINNMYCPRTLGISITNTFDGFSLQVLGLISEGQAVVSAPFYGTDNQKWTVHWDDLQDDNVGSTLVSWSQNGGLVKDMNDEGDFTNMINMRGHSGLARQNWAIRFRGNGSDNNPWQIVNLDTGKCVISNRLAQAGTVPCVSNEPAQLWNIYAA